MRRTRRSVLSAAALGLALAATGCTYLSPVQTKDFYEAADGTNANIEQDGALFAGVRNAVLVVQEDGTAVFSATVANYAHEDITVDLTGLDDGTSVFSASVDVPAQGVTELGIGEGRQEIPVGAVETKPGTIIELEVTADSETTVVSLPVVDTSLTHFQSEQPAEG